MNAIKNFERYCRLCGEEQEVTIMLFSPEAADMLLLEKLRNYLLIEIGENEKLPKSICIKCCSKLQTLCEFVELVRKAQDNLQALSLTNEMLNSTTTTMDAIKEETIEFTEVCIDPMDVLNMSDEPGTEQQKYPYAEEFVTLKLIPKNETEEIKQAKKKFICNVCDKSFLVEQSLKNHSWTHIRNEEYSCFTCQRSFKLPADLDKHIKSHKPTTTGFLYNCNICGRRFKTMYTYEAHMQIHKTSTKAYTCEICGRSYGNWAGLKIHNITHSPEKPFQCSICDKKFKRNQELKFHMNHHTGAKPYKCKYCDKCFASTGNLYSHRNRVHPNGKKVLKFRETPTADQTNIVFKESKTNIVFKEPKNVLKYQCQFCKKCCGRQENYVYHMFLHTGQKPYKCIQCPQKFITPRSLSLHYDNVHPNITKPPMYAPVFCPIKLKWM